MPVDEQGSGSSQRTTWNDSRSTEGDNSSRKLELEYKSGLLEILVARPRLILWEPVLSLLVDEIDGLLKAFQIYERGSGIYSTGARFVDRNGVSNNYV